MIECVSACQHVSHPSQQSGSQGGFCLFTRWWGGAAKAYFATLLYALSIACSFEPVAEGWAYVVWATQPRSTHSSHNKILLDVGLEHLGYKTCWSVDSWNPCSFLLRQNICFTEKLKAKRKHWTLSFSIELKTQVTFFLVIMFFSCALKLLMGDIHGYLLTCCKNYQKSYWG